MKEIQEVKEEVERVCFEMRTSNQFYRQVFDQKISLERLSIYTTNVTYLVSQTPAQLNLAQVVSKAQGLSKLSTFFEEKILEEQGHDKWGQQDLDCQRQLGSRIKEIPRLNKMTELVDYNRSTIKRDPTLYLAYIFFAEYETVLNTPLLLEGLQKSSIPSSVLSILANHAELDKDHIDDWQSEVGNLVDFKIYKDPFKQVIQNAARLYTEFCNQCCEEIYDIAV